MKDDSGRTRTGVPTMFVAAPIRDDSFQVVGVLALRIDPEKEFSRILSLGRFGESGETYAFDKNGLMVSNSRFDDDLILLGLLPDRRTRSRFCNCLVRDPGGDITAGHRPDGAAPRIAADARGGRSGRRARRRRTSTAIATIAACRSSAPGSGCRTATSASSRRSTTPRPFAR